MDCSGVRWSNALGLTLRALALTPICLGDLPLALGLVPSALEAFLIIYGDVITGYNLSIVFTRFVWMSSGKKDTRFARIETLGFYTNMSLLCASIDEGIPASLRLRIGGVYVIQEG